MGQTDMARQQAKPGNSYLMEMEDGSLVRVPEEKLEAWERADHKAPLTPAERQLKERLLASIYGSKR